jgi:hypothetical protein
MTRVLICALQRLRMRGSSRSPEFRAKKIFTSLNLCENRVNKASRTEGGLKLPRELAPPEKASRMPEHGSRRAAIEAEQQCSRCKVAYRLVGIEPAEQPDHWLYTFECLRCGHVETTTARVQ